MFLPKICDKRFITIRRGGILTDEDHRLLAVWAADCAAHVLHIFKDVCPNDDRPRRAVEAARDWVNGEIKMMRERDFDGASQDAAREVKEISEVVKMATAPKDENEIVRQRECEWQRDMLPEKIRELVLDDQRLRNDICWFVFDT